MHYSLSFGVMWVLLRFLGPMIQERHEVRLRMPAMHQKEKYVHEIDANSSYKLCFHAYTSCYNPFKIPKDMTADTVT